MWSINNGLSTVAQRKTHQASDTRTTFSCFIFYFRGDPLRQMRLSRRALQQSAFNIYIIQRNVSKQLRKLTNGLSLKYARRYIPFLGLFIG